MRNNKTHDVGDENYPNRPFIEYQMSTKISDMTVWFASRDILLRNMDDVEFWIKQDVHGRLFRVPIIVQPTSFIAVVKSPKNRTCIFTYTHTLMDMLFDNIWTFIPIISRNMAYFKRFYETSLQRLSIREWAAIYAQQQTRA